jgi:hypothetical protein
MSASTGRYVYSFDRETFIGSFPTRDAAYQAAVVKASGMENTPTEIFVGERIQGDPQTSGHARAILKEMTRRARATAGEQAYSFLRQVTEQEEADLDAALERTITEWLARHERLPTFFRVKGISEYPVPLMTGGATPMVRSPNNGEVHDLGESRW